MLLKPSLRAWAKSHVGIIARKSLVSLLGTAGLLGSIELVSIARNSASDPGDQQALDALLVSLTKMREARAKRNDWDGAYVAAGGMGLFVAAVSVLYSVKRCLNRKNSSDTSLPAPQGVMEEPQCKELRLCVQPDAKVSIPTEVVESDGIVTM